MTLGINVRPIVGLSLIYLMFFFVSPYISLKKIHKTLRTIYLSSLIAVSIVALAVQLIFQIQNVRNSLDLHKMINLDVIGIIDYSKSRYVFDDFRFLVNFIYIWYIISVFGTFVL